MRMLHLFDDESPATRLADALYVEGIEASVRESRDGQWSVWVHDEPEMERAEALLARYLASPDDPAFAERQSVARAQRRAERARDQQLRKREDRLRASLEQADARPWMPMLIIGVAVGFYLLGEVRPEIPMALLPQGRGATFVDALLDGLTSQPWTFVTPIFIHAGILHLLFNGLWIWQLGGLFERAHSPWRLLLATALFGLAGVLLELVWTGAAAVGLSGVVYGLLGYLFVRGRFDPMFPFAIPKTTMVWMMVWFALCFTPGFRIANGAHTAGLVLGALSGYLAAKRRR